MKMKIRIMKVGRASGMRRRRVINTGGRGEGYLKI
jgi:hypothetical protein